MWTPIVIGAPFWPHLETFIRNFLSLPARNEWGESRREGQSMRVASSPRPSPPLWGGEGENFLQQDGGCIKRPAFWQCRFRMEQNRECAILGMRESIRTNAGE